MTLNGKELAAMVRLGVAMTLCDRDNWMKPQEAIKLGFLDAIVKRSE